MYPSDVTVSFVSSFIFNSTCAHGTTAYLPTYSLREMHLLDPGITRLPEKYSRRIGLRVNDTIKARSGIVDRPDVVTIACDLSPRGSGGIA